MGHHEAAPIPGAAPPSPAEARDQLVGILSDIAESGRRTVTPRDVLTHPHYAQLQRSRTWVAITMGCLARQGQLLQTPQPGTYLFPPPADPCGSGRR